MTTKLLHMTNCYLKEFNAKVIDRGDNYVVLDQTAFYPLGGGQPSDQGTLNGVKVIEVRKDNGMIKHFMEKPIEGDDVHGILDWERRYAFMRMHSSQHLLSGIVIEISGAETAGNQIGKDHSRIDFRPFKPTEEDIKVIEKKFNEWVDKEAEVRIYFSTREKVMEDVDEKRRVLFSRLPEFIKDIRVVEIWGIDKVPCGGAHVANTKELGHIKITGVENKGLETTRIVFKLEN